MCCEPSNLLILVLGVLGGIIVGIIPGLGVVMAVALLIPFTFTMAPEVGMSLLVACSWAASRAPA